MEYEEIIQRKKNITESPVHPLPEETVHRLVKEFTQCRMRSKQLYEEAKTCLTEGVQHNLSPTFPFPLAMDHGEGYKLYDVDGNEYIDYLMCGAPIILGHHFKPLDEKIAEHIRTKGPTTGLTSEYEILAAKQIKKMMPTIEKIRFVQSGSEAIMAALRIARVKTGHRKIIKIDGNYHGWGDQTVIGLHVPGTGMMMSAGIPPECLANTITVMPNDFQGLRKAFIDAEQQGKVAACLVEANGGEAGTHPVHPEWNRYVRELCDEYGSLMIMDEVITGFRLAKGGAQEYYNVKPDLVTLGKILMHGYPSCGAVAGRSDVLEVLAGGEGSAAGSHAFVAGTMAANALSTMACYYALKYVDEYNASEKAAAYAEKLTSKLNSLFETRPDLPFFAYNQRSIIIYDTTAFFSVDVRRPDALMQVMNRMKIAKTYQLAILNKGVMTLAGSRMYTCMQHDEYALEKTLEAWEYLLSLIPKK
ncbi:MAG: aminotransferase class III-fold pyridoxal phosphate-dependent enzyme [Candidatus Thermoplasmatota archaeon]|nr:aminotransferase class III-fold pyridoxal phosphate-dependent enzyme [Candidatus Thermoplasmatota archaeon]